MSPVSVQVVIINNVTRRMTRSVYSRATWRSVGHLTTYGPIDNPTSVTPFFLLWREEKRRTRINQEPEPTILQLQYHPEVIPTLISDITDQESGIITKRDNTRSLLPRPINHITFTKENPSCIDP